MSALRLDPKALAGTVSAPVWAAYADWQAYSARVNGPETSCCTDEAMEGYTDRLSGLVARIIATPSVNPSDVVLKFLVTVEDYQFFNGIPDLEPLAQEARAVFGGLA